MYLFNTQEVGRSFQGAVAGAMPRTGTMMEALNRARYPMHHREKQIRTENLHATIQALSLMVELRDPYTANHQKRVADLAAAIARELDFPDDEVQAIKLAAMVHDIGKIRIPAEILSKPGRLSDIELLFVKTHPQAGYAILAGIDSHWPIARMVLEHHERLDGSGYPHGLSKGQILIESQIIAVADTVEAMASHRPYRPALGIAAALKEIEEGRGVTYDEMVVDACVKLFCDNKYVLAFDTFGALPEACIA